MTLTMGSLFSGSGGFELAGLLTGRIQPVWASEIEPFAVMVTRRRMPWLRHEGDITKMDGAKAEPVDIITGGSPCQDLSVAGRRAGLEGERSSLFLEMIRIIKEMQNAADGRYPRYVVWENVPGAFSSNKGQDFRRVLEEFTSLFSPGTDIPMPRAGTWATAGYILGNDHGSLAWRTLDAQYWGVPQRRRRIFLVCDTLGGRAPEILFESESVFRHLAESLGTWQGASAGAGRGALPTVEGWDGSLMDICSDDVPSCLDGEAAEGKAPPGNMGTGGNNTPMALCPGTAGPLQARGLDSHPQDGRISFAGDTSQTLPGNMGTGGNNTPMVLCPGTAAPLQARETSGLPFLDNQSLFGTEPQLICVPGGTGQDGGATMSGNMGTGGNNTPMVMQETYALSHNDFMTKPSEEVADSLLASAYKDPTVISQGWQVRRLTPTECARLQGFPDRWAKDLALADEDITEDEMSFWRQAFSWARKKKTDTAIRQWLKNPHSDTAEYKLWGNGVALPCATYVMCGIADTIRKEDI